MGRRWWIAAGLCDLPLYLRHDNEELFGAPDG